MDDAGMQSWIWPLPEGGASNDQAALDTRWQVLLGRGGWQAEVLGQVGDDALRLYVRPSAAAAAPRLLIAAGFHGEEPAGPWGVLQFFERADAGLLDRLQLTVLPLVNASGFRAGRRFNDWGENPNRGHGASADAPPSREGRVLAAHGARLAALGASGVLSCHEDVKQPQHGYVYSLERAERPGAFSHALLAANARFFPLLPDGDVDGCHVRGGIVFNRYDGSFEAWMMEQGVGRAACVETPGRAPIGERIAAQAAMVEAFVRHPLDGA
ncbi:succinylglutamate desuccinylase/aspartoacylase family protein [Aquincola sp. S2]|uniref:Succinylglutamate desuccinylase/aspartoacylase family protein n=1 Tax=Pseudaquabacterium terrae TaxID=2732868 RepID=A0ABX2ELH8_9BURK|nr:succinylglutamate desuccinylase/aspartoacylase family protein [Aquabacterium terrae]NRF69501.1 succinylglutamate desuccinylase/aspartoacylase family protein [Aquabacterium terrae]